MKSPCELICNLILPSLRAWIAKEAVENFKARQKDVAECLGLTDAAISQYLHRKRAKIQLGKRELKEIKPLIIDIARKISTGEVTDLDSMRLICQTCISLRSLGTMCRLHKKVEPKLKKLDCRFCIELFAEYRKINFIDDYR